MSAKLTPYQRIMRNAKKNKGVVLSADEVFDLTMDDAIMTRAALDDSGHDPREGSWRQDEIEAEKRAR